MNLGIRIIPLGIAAENIWQQQSASKFLLLLSYRLQQDHTFKELQCNGKKNLDILKFKSLAPPFHPIVQYSVMQDRIIDEKFPVNIFMSAAIHSAL
jgi:hypothetical protein